MIFLINSNTTSLRLKIMVTNIIKYTIKISNNNIYIFKSYNLKLILIAISVLYIFLSICRPCKSKQTNKRYALKCLLDKSRSRQELSLQMRCSPHAHIVKVKDIYANEVQFPREPEPRFVYASVMRV